MHDDGGLKNTSYPVVQISLQTSNLCGSEVRVCQSLMFGLWQSESDLRPLAMHDEILDGHEAKLLLRNLALVLTHDWFKCWECSRTNDGLKMSLKIVPFYRILNQMPAYHEWSPKAMFLSEFEQNFQNFLGASRQNFPRIFSTQNLILLPTAGHVTRTK